MNQLDPSVIVNTAQPPKAGGSVGLQVLKALAHERSLLAALEEMQAQVGDVFQITLPNFSPVVLAGPEAARFVLVTDRDRFLWRNERDPVTRLLHHGVLVEDHASHDELRAAMMPALSGQRLTEQAEAMWRYTDQILDVWENDTQLDMLVDMRRVALVILMGTLFGVEFLPDLDRLWPSILAVLDYIAPGFWIVWPEMPRPWYRRRLRELDDYLYQIIRHRRAAPDHIERGDLLSRLVSMPDMDDDLIRDQLLTMLIAGHDTSTALLAWTLYLLGAHPAAMTRAQAEVDDVLRGSPPAMDHLSALSFLDQVIKEALRLYPPIHVSNRIAATELEFQGYHIPAGTRVMFSIYLTQRHPGCWQEPARFRPERFSPEQRGTRPALSYVPFGAGPRNCIGATFAQIEAKIVLAHILQTFDLQLTSDEVHTHMGATLEPRPGVLMRVRRRRR